MKRFSQTVVALLLIVATCFNAGCANTADGRATQAGGAVIGTLLGAGVGALLGAATGNSNNIARFAAGGAALGAAAGFAYGTDVAKRKAKYVKKEDWLNSEIAAAHQTNNAAYAYNRNLRQRVAALDQRIQAAKAQKNAPALKSLKSELSQLSKEVQTQDQKLAAASKDQKEILTDKTAQSAANFAAYRKESDSYNQAKAERGQLVNRIAGLENSIDR